MNVDAAFRTAKHAVRAFLAVLALATTAVAQDWPTKTVRIVVPFGPGTSSRALSPMACSRNTLPAHLSWRTSPAPATIFGTDLVAKATPDGSTIGVSIGGPLAINTLLYARLPYDPRMDIATVTQLVTQPSVLAVNPALEVSLVADLIALPRKNPGKYNFASIGNGSLSHLAMEAIAIKAGAQLVHIPYPSSPQAITAVIRNDAQIACLPAIAVTPRAETGAVKILAVSTEKRSPYLPDLPTLKESGIDVEADAWNGLIVPGATPKPIIDKISEDVAEIIRQPMLREKLPTQLMEPVGSSPDELRARINGEIERWAPVIEAANVKLN